MGVGEFFTRRAQDNSNSAQDQAIPLAFLGSIVESSDDAIVGMTLDGLIISWNAAATRIFGHAQADAIGQPIKLLIPAELHDEEQRILEKVRRGERVDHFETIRMTKEGRQFPVSLTVSPVRDATGTVFAVSEVARDIEAQKGSERASSQLAAIVESSDDAVVSKSLDGIIQSWNAGAERIFGYTADEIIGKHITTIIPPELQDEERTIIDRIRSGERIEHFDTIRLGKNGRRIPVSLTVSPIRDPRGTIIGASKIARDITDRQRAQREIHESRHKLASEASALARLSEASTRLWESQNLAAGLDEILRTVMALAGASKGNIQLLNPGRNTLSIVAHEGFDAGFLATFEHMSAEDRGAACGRALTARRPVIIEDVLADETYAPFHEVARAAGYRAVVSVPLFGGRWIEARRDLRAFSVSASAHRGANAAPAGLLPPGERFHPADPARAHAPGARGSVAGCRPPQGRISRAAGARAAQPLGADPLRRCRRCAIRPRRPSRRTGRTTSSSARWPT